MAKKKKSEKSRFPFGFRTITRSAYAWECSINGWQELTDDECLDLFAFYDPHQHGTGRETQIAASRGWTIAKPFDLAKAKFSKKTS